MTQPRLARWLLCTILAGCGAPAAPDAPVQFAERGLGGTGGITGGTVRPPPPPTGGGPTLPRPPIDRGIGGTGLARALDSRPATTGIAGMITGFGSIFVNGLEVGIDGVNQVTMDDVSVPVAALRVGQFAVMRASSAGDARASSHDIAVRHEVAGRVAGTGKTGLLMVAGQLVRLSPATLGGATPRIGDWIAVSGLRNIAGEIVATRVDPSPRGRIIVHGTMRWDEGALRIGALPVETGSAISVIPEGLVSASGVEIQGVLHADTLTPDLLAADPPMFFGPAVEHFLIEAYTRPTDHGGIELAQGPHLVTSRTILAPFSPAGRSIIGFDRRPGGAFVTTSFAHAASSEPPVYGAPGGARGAAIGGDPAGGQQRGPSGGSQTGFGNQGGGSAPGYAPAPMPAPDSTPNPFSAPDAGSGQMNGPGRPGGFTNAPNAANAPGVGMPANGSGGPPGLSPRPGH